MTQASEITGQGHTSEERRASQQQTPWPMLQQKRFSILTTYCCQFSKLFLAS